MKFERKNKIYTADTFASGNRELLYHSVIKCPDGIVRMFICRWNKENKVIFFESINEGETFRLKYNSIIQGSGISHNFYPFLSYDGNKLYAIGGLDSWKHQKSWRQITDFEEFKRIFLERFDTPYIRSNVHWEGVREKLIHKGTLDHVDGLYLLSSKNGRKWTIENKGNPIIKAILPKHPGYWSALELGKSTEFDGHLSCVWNHRIGKYILYIRKNIQLNKPKVRIGIRYIQYATSDDLVNWSEFKEINIEGFDKNTENYYSPIFFQHPENYTLTCGFLPFYLEKKGVGEIRIVKSFDGINFQMTDKIFPDKVSYLKSSAGKTPKNYDQMVNGIIMSNDRKKLSFYIYHNYLGLVGEKPVDIMRYDVSMKEFNRSLGL